MKKVGQNEALVLVTFNIIISCIFPENSIEMSEAQKA